MTCAYESRERAQWISADQRIPASSPSWLTSHVLWNIETNREDHNFKLGSSARGQPDFGHGHFLPAAPRTTHSGEASLLIFFKYVKRAVHIWDHPIFFPSRRFNPWDPYLGRCVNKTPDCIHRPQVLWRNAPRIEGTLNARPRTWENVSVDHRRSNIRMSKELLDHPDVASIL